MGGRVAPGHRELRIARFRKTRSAQALSTGRPAPDGKRSPPAPETLRIPGIAQSQTRGCGRTASCSGLLKPLFGFAAPPNHAILSIEGRSQWVVAAAWLVHESRKRTEPVAR